jgi:hypothetical protein
MKDAGSVVIVLRRDIEMMAPLQFIVCETELATNQRGIINLIIFKK